MKRSTIVRLADALEDAMTEAGRRENEAEMRLWLACLPAWDAARHLLRGHREGRELLDAIWDEEEKDI